MVIIDIESNGLTNLDKLGITQVGMVGLDRNNDIEWTRLFNLYQPWYHMEAKMDNGEYVCSLAGISRESHAKYEQDFIPSLKEIARLVSREYIGGHNVIKFDWPHLTSFLSSQNIAYYQPQGLWDTMTVSKDFVRATTKAGRLKNPNLGELTRHYNVDFDQVTEIYNKSQGNTGNPSFHDGLFDAIATALVVKPLLADLNRGV